MKLTYNRSERTCADGALSFKQMTLISLFSCAFACAVTLQASQPGWWTATNGPVNTSLATNDYAAINEGQVKEFTTRAVDDLNTGLTTSGGAGSALSNLVYNWKQDYATNNYATDSSNPTKPYKPSDFQAVNVGQLKYIGNLVWTQLFNAQYTAIKPSWLAATNAADNSMANIGELKTVFNFDLSLSPPQIPANLTVVLGSTQASLSWSDSSSVTSYYVQQSTDGGVTWTTVATVSGTTTNDTVSIPLGSNYLFRVIAGGTANSSSQPSSGDAAPIITLNAPTGATLVP